MIASRVSAAQAAGVGGLFVVAVLSVLLAVSLVDGDRSGPTGPATLPQETESPTDLPTEVPTGLDTVDFRVSTYEVFLARDPFEPVVPEPATDGGDPGTGDPTTSPTTSPTSSPTGSPTTSPTTSPTSNPTTSPTTSPTASPSPSPGGPGSGSGCVQDGATVCDGQTVKLVDVFVEDGESRAVVQIGTTLHDVSVGDLFATHFRVLAIDPPSVTLQYGDDRFSLHEGETVLK